MLAQQFDFMQALRPLEGFTGEIYLRYYPIIDFALVSIIAISIARSKLGEKWGGGKDNRALTAIGLLMGAILAAAEVRYNFNLLGFWPFVIIFIIAVFLQFIFAIVKKNRLMSGITLLALWAIFNGPTPMLKEVNIALSELIPFWPLITTAWMVSGIILTLLGIFDLWQLGGGGSGIMDRIGNALSPGDKNGKGPAPKKKGGLFGKGDKDEIPEPGEGEEVDDKEDETKKVNEKLAKATSEFHTVVGQVEESVYMMTQAANRMLVERHQFKQGKSRIEVPQSQETYNTSLDFALKNMDKMLGLIDEFYSLEATKKAKKELGKQFTADLNRYKKIVANLAIIPRVVQFSYEDGDADPGQSFRKHLPAWAIK